MSYDNLAVIEALAKIAEAVGEVNINFDAQTVLDALKTVDGAGSGLDADMVDGLHAVDVRNPVKHTDEYSSLGFTNGNGGSNVSLDAEGWGASAAMLFQAYRVNPRQVGGDISAIGNVRFSGTNPTGATRPALLYYLGNGGIFKFLLGDTGLSEGDDVPEWICPLRVGGDGIYVEGDLRLNGELVRVTGVKAASKAHLIADQTITAGIYTVVQYADQVYDIGGNYSPETYQFTAPEDGIYHVNAAVMWGVSGWGAGDQMTVSLFKNGEEYLKLDTNQTDTNWSTNPGAASAFYCTGGADLELNAGDEIDIRVWHNATGSGTVGLHHYYDRWNRFSVHKVA